MYISKTYTKAITAFLLVASLFISGCQKNFTDENPSVDPINISSTSVEGRITDETGLPIYGALVKAGLNNTQTDKNGLFKFTNASFSSTENFVTVTKSGYFQGSRTFFARENSNNFVKIQLLKRTISARISASAGGDVELRGNGGTVHFDPNTIVTSSGALYNGTVLVATQYLNPTLPNINDIMPGDLRGTNTAGGTVGLKSFGMLAVELTDEAGQKLLIKTGSTANISLNIPASLLATAPATIPLWFFNDVTGLWKQEGLATKTGDSYIGDVTHFTFWNCDDPYEYVKIKAKIVSSAGVPIASAKVQITSASGGSAYDYTDNNGYVDGFVPKNQLLTLTVLNSCNQAVYNNNIGPFTTLTDLGNITITQNTTTIYGTATNCSNTAVTNGYVQISLNSTVEYAGITNGSFSYTFINCNGNASATLLAIDNTTLQQGNNVIINLTTNNVNAGALVACGVSANTFFNLTINGTLLSANTPNYTRQGWKDTSYTQNGECDYLYVAYDTTLEKYIYCGFLLPVNQVFTTPISFPADSTFFAGYSGINTNAEEVGLSAISNTQQVTFTEYGFLGQFIAGNTTGQFRRERYQLGSGSSNTVVDTVNVVMNFRVRHTSVPF